MLTKGMLTPLKLARLAEWNGRLGKPSAIMAIDICNHHIGIALGYYRKQKLPSQKQTSLFDSEPEPSSASGTTSLVALPPIPYMSSDPYHPSYAFLHHHRPETSNMTHSLDRSDRTMEVADQLAQLAQDRKVNGVLVRWPGDLASTVSGGKPNVESTRVVEEGHLLLPNRGTTGGVGKAKSDGSMGYMRGRILYVLDACFTSHGHNQNSVHSEPLLSEGTRPFALYDTSMSERNWIAYEQQNKYSKAVHPMIPKSCDRYGNSLTEIDPFGRAAIFGNKPPEPEQGQYRYSSKQQYSGYRVSSDFGEGSSTDRKGGRNAQPRYDNFDNLDNHESRVNQFQGSLSALHALYDFAKENLQGRIALPSWASQAASTPSRAGRSQTMGEGSFESLGSVRSNARESRSAEKSTLVGANNERGTTNLRVGATGTVNTPHKKPNGLNSLVQMPKRKARRRSRQESS